MLKQLKKTKHGAPKTSDEDVPKELHAEDTYWFERWDWILDEMIWGFEQINDDFVGNYEERKAHQDRLDNSFCLFGKYFQELWD